MIQGIKKAIAFLAISLVIIQQSALPAFADKPKDILGAKISLSGGSYVLGDTIVFETQYLFEEETEYATAHENSAKVSIELEDGTLYVLEKEKKNNGVYTLTNSTFTDDSEVLHTLVEGTHKLILTYPEKPAKPTHVSTTLLISKAENENTDDQNATVSSTISTGVIKSKDSNGSLGEGYDPALKVGDTINFVTQYTYSSDAATSVVTSTPTEKIEVMLLDSSSTIIGTIPVSTDGHYSLSSGVYLDNNEEEQTLDAGLYRLVLHYYTNGIDGETTSTHFQFTIEEAEEDTTPIEDIDITSGQIILTTSTPYYTGTTLPFVTAYQYGTSTTFVSETLTSSTIALWYQTMGEVGAPGNFVQVANAVISATDEQGNYALTIPTSTILSWGKNLGTYKLSLEWPKGDTMSETVYSDTFTITTQPVVQPTTPAISFVSTTSSANEDAGTAQITVELSEVSDEDVVVSYTLGGNASSSDDFTVSPTTEVTIAAGSTTTAFTITIVNDTAVEEAETITLTLGEVTTENATIIADASVHTLNIADNDTGEGSTGNNSGGGNTGSTGGSTGGNTSNGSSGGGIIPGNAPVANAGPDLTIIAGSSAILDGSGSTDIDNNIRFWVWNFGDGSPTQENADQATTSHVFTTPGVYTVTLTVIDSTGLRSSDTATVTVVSTTQTETPVDTTPDTTPSTPVVTPTTPAAPGGTGGSTTPTDSTSPSTDTDATDDTTPAEEAEVVVATPDSSSNVVAENTSLTTPAEETGDEEAPEWVRIAFGSGALLAAVGAGVWINRVRKLV